MTITWKRTQNKIQILFWFYGSYSVYVLVICTQILCMRHAIYFSIDKYFCYAKMFLLCQNVSTCYLICVRFCILTFWPIFHLFFTTFRSFVLYVEYKKKMSEMLHVVHNNYIEKILT